MKTVSGKVTATIPISLSDAAKSLSKFGSSNHEASHAVSLYLERAADSFNHLVKVHQKLGLKNEHSADEVSESKKNREVVGSLENNKSKNLVMEADTRRSKTKNSAKIDDQKLIRTEKRVDTGEDETVKTKKNELEFVKIDEGKGQKLIKSEKRVDIGEGETEKSKKNELKMESDGMKSTDKKKRKKKNRGVGDGEQEVGKVEEDLGYKAEGEGKMRKNLDLDAGENAGSAERSSKKKSKKRRVEGAK